MGTLWVGYGYITGKYTHNVPIYNPLKTHLVLN